MDCKTAQILSDRYLSDGLSFDVLPEYLRHIRTCEDCKESLRTDYSITKAIEQINKNQDFSTDYSLELEQKLERSRQSILRRNRILLLKKAFVIGFLAVVAFFLALRNDYSIRYYLPSGSEESLRIVYYGLPSECDPVQTTIREKNDEVIEKLRELHSKRGNE
ncbi:MAG: hypothetical protein IKX54_02755 [Lachnospiraceae bacterium]|nr:hypothetical protein [Lachnospiraceae bacterium]